VRKRVSEGMYTGRFLKLSKSVLTHTLCVTLVWIQYLHIHTHMYTHAEVPLYSSLTTSMFTNSVASDFLYLRYSALTQTPDAVFPGGVFATSSYDVGQIICVPRGHLIPYENISYYDVSAIITYQVSFPLRDGTVEKEEDEYVLVDNTICSRIRFCFPSPARQPEGMGSCGNAILSRVEATGTVMVKALKDIPVEEEIVMELHSFFYLDTELFQELCQFDPHGCEITSNVMQSTKDNGVISSEEQLLFLAPSTVPGAGLGVFTKRDIPAFHIVTLCVGKVFHVLYNNDADKPERLTAPLSLTKSKVSIQMDNICGFTNDIVDVRFMENTSHTKLKKEDRGPLPLHPGLQCNAMQGGGDYRISAMISSQFIPAFSEVLQPYGDEYWWYRYEIKHNMDHGYGTRLRDIG
jgi:hypothetical protein